MMPREPRKELGAAQVATLWRRGSNHVGGVRGLILNVTKYASRSWVLPYQVAGTGMFLQVVDRADLTGNYSETSGSAMVAYALMKGARLGMLPPEYGEKGSRVLDGIRDTYLKKGEQGWELHGICASAGLGPGPDNRTDRTGTPEYYLSEKQMVDNQHGAAACMMAVSEQLRRA